MLCDKIIVSGPHRAGTRLVAKCFAATLDYHFLSEDAVCPWILNRTIADAEHRLLSVLDDKSPMVLQAPYFSYMLGRFRWENLLVIMVRRAPPDIYRSRMRARMPGGGPVDWGRTHQRMLECYGVDKSDDMVGLVYRRWRQDRERIPMWLEVNYQDFADHPLWVDDRSGWHISQ